MGDMSHICVEAWGTAGQVIANRLLTLYRCECQNPERVIWRAPFALGIRKILREIGTGEIEEILFALEDPTFFSPGCHY